MAGSPAFGQADLSNCERELIHLAGSVQPHGMLLALREPDLTIIQVSSNVQRQFGQTLDAFLNQPLAALRGDVDATVRRLAAEANLAEPVPLGCHLLAHGKLCEFEGTLHRAPGALLLELEAVDSDAGAAPAVHFEAPVLLEHVHDAVQRFSMTSTIGTLADAVVKCFRELAGYDRVMVYKFDPDGHGQIIAEARDARLESLLGHHYPASDIPQRARELYLRTRLRVLVDVQYEPAALVPRKLPGAQDELDMSLCHLRSMSPLHIQYLKNMGVAATLVVSLVREGRLWGLIACHHYSPRNLRFAVRAAADLLAEVVSTRIAAIENYAHAQVAIQVRRLEQRLVEATSTEGDWRLALFRNPRTLLQPLDANGAALFHEGEVLTAGEVPSTPELRALLQCVDAQDHSDGPFHCSSVSRLNPELDSLTPTASGVLAVKLSASRPEYLMWFRKEQLHSVTWAGDPSKSAIGNDPMDLSPRRSFAAWSEIVRGTALPWSAGEVAVARAFGAALVDIIVQINAVRLLIAEHQLTSIRASVANSREPVLIVDAQRRALFANDAFAQLTGYATRQVRALGDMATLFTHDDATRRMMDALAHERHSWRGELSLKLDGARALPVAVRAEVVPARDGSVLGFFLIFDDLTEVQLAAAARSQLEAALAQARQEGLEARAREPDELIGAILANASLAAMDIADGNTSVHVAPLLRELEVSTKRATALYGRLRAFSPKS
jgi:chemotaxis family two-component system sensor kinase Cph1